MALSRRHYEAVAAKFASLARPSNTPLAEMMRKKLARDMADVFAEDSPRFDRARFLADCLVGDL